MDIQLKKKKGLRAKNLPYLIGGLILVSLMGWMLFGNHQPTLRVDRDATLFHPVKKEVFNDFIRIDGQVQPISVIQLSALEGGIIEEILVEEGAMVRKGDPIIRLSNSNLDLSILSSEAELAEKQNFLRNTQVAMEQDKLNNRTEKLQLDLDVRRKRRAYMNLKSLYDEHLIAKEEYLQASEDYELAKEKQRLVTERLRQDSIFRSVQIDQMEESLHTMRKNMLLIRKRVDNLLIKSPIDGELGFLDIILGQNLTMGQKIGLINNLSDYKVEALIDEHYIDRIRSGLQGSVERQNLNHSLSVRKVYPEVRAGKFKTDFIFTGERPDNIRSGQTYYINLEMGQPSESITIPKGTFFQATGGSWIFVVDKEGKQAHRRAIKIGRQNPYCYEILEGLKAGEQVIVTNYNLFKENEILIFNE